MPFDKNGYQRSANMGFNISYSYFPGTAVYVDVTYNFLRMSDNYYDFDGKTSGLMEATMGARLYGPEVNPKIFFDFGLGYYQKFYYYEDSYGGFTETKDDLGINIGLGTDVIIHKDLSFSAKGKLHFINFIIGERPLIYWGIYSGIKYNF